MAKIYISGKITGLDNYQELFEQAEKMLSEKGFEPVSPVKLKEHETHNKSWESYMRIDLIYLLNCDCVYMLNNWTKSKGACMEHYIAHKLKIPIFYQ